MALPNKPHQNLRGSDPIWREYFSDGLKPPSRNNRNSNIATFHDSIFFHEKPSNPPKLPYQKQGFNKGLLTLHVPLIKVFLFAHTSGGRVSLRGVSKLSHDVPQDFAVDVHCNHEICWPQRDVTIGNLSVGVSRMLQAIPEDSSPSRLDALENVVAELLLKVKET